MDVKYSQPVSQSLVFTELKNIGIALKYVFAVLQDELGNCFEI